MPNAVSIISKTFFLIIWERRKKITVVAIAEFLAAAVADFFNPKYPVVKIMFFVSLTLLGVCIYLLARWLKLRQHRTVPAIQHITNTDTGVGESLIAGIPFVSLLLITSSFFLVFQLFSKEGDKGALASSFPKIAAIQQILLDMDNQLTSIYYKLDDVKKETSPDARKELQNMGVPWTGENFLNAVKDGDERVVALFLKGGMHPETANSQGRTLPVMLALNKLNPELILHLLLENGLNINRVYEQATGAATLQCTLLSAAIERGNIQVVEALIDNHVDVNKGFTTPASLGLSTALLPLAAAIYWKQPAIAFMLLDADADISLEDYQAYQQAMADRNNYFWKEHAAEINKIITATAPSGNRAASINAGLRIEEINQEITKLALLSMQSAFYPEEKKQYDRQIDKLQAEKKELQKLTEAK